VREPAARPEPAERVPLALKPRGSVVEETPSVPLSASQETKNKVNPFGAAKPRDEAEFQKRAEERKKEREEKEQKEREATQQKETADDAPVAAAAAAPVAAPVAAKPAAVSEDKPREHREPREPREPRDTDKRPSTDFRDKQPRNADRGQNVDRKNFNKDSRGPQQRGDNKGPAGAGKSFDSQRGNRSDFKKTEPKVPEKKAEEPRPARKPAAPAVKKVEENANIFAMLGTDEEECP